MKSEHNLNGKLGSKIPVCKASHFFKKRNKFIDSMELQKGDPRSCMTKNISN